MFSILRPYIFSLDPEVAHDLAIKSLKANFLPKSFFDVADEKILETKLFNKIQDFQVETNIRDLFNLVNRTTYTGNFNFHTKGEFVKSLQKFLGDRYPKDDDWSDSILYRPNHDEMDRGEWV